MLRLFNRTPDAMILRHSWQPRHPRVAFGSIDDWEQRPQQIVGGIRLNDHPIIPFNVTCSSCGLDEASVQARPQPTREAIGQVDWSKLKIAWNSVASIELKQ
jgi:hypothetical protein